MPKGIYTRKPFTDERKKRMREVQLVAQNRPEVLEKQRLSHTGRKYTPEHCKAVSDSLKGKNFGRVGENHPRWIKDRNQVKGRQERNNPEYKQWRMNVWSRDDFKCRINNKNCKGRIEAHHILGWTEYPELHYEINNGITLCHAHHPRKRAEEKRLVPYFMGLVPVSKV